MLEKVAKQYRSELDDIVTLATLLIFETHFKINVNIYTVDVETETIFPDLKSSSDHAMSMNVLYYQIIL